MANKDNQSQRFIYIRSLKEKVPCTEQQFQEFYREATRIRKQDYRILERRLLYLRQRNCKTLRSQTAYLCRPDEEN